MKIIVTAGGTSEKIDDVRTITNSSTGRLGMAIGEAFAKAAKENENIEKVYYLHGERADHPKDGIIQPIVIGGVMDLYREMKRLLETEKIDAVVHAMAVSDYMLKEVSDAEGNILRKGASYDPVTGEVIGAEGKTGEGPEAPEGKISYDMDELVIRLTRSPKVIKIIKEISPETLLIGFKILSNV